MEKTDNQEVVNYRSKVADRMKTRFPDRNYDEEGQGNDLYESVNQYMDESDQKIADYEGQIKSNDEWKQKFTNILKTDPKAARFFKEWAVSGNGAEAFRREYGSKAWEMMNTEEGAAMLAQITQEENEKQAQYDKAMEEFQQNYQTSLQSLDSWGNNRGLSDDEKVSVMESIIKIIEDGETGVYPESLFEAAYKAGHYDADVESARHEGEVAGRNAKIKEGQVRRQAAQQFPPAVSGQGVAVPERRQTRENDPWMLG